MTTNMRREAKESPDCVAKFLESETTGIEKLAQAMRSSPGGACLTVARGSSDCAAAYFSTAMALLTGRLVTSLPPSLVSVYHAPLNFGDAWLVAKIERAEAIGKLESIIDAADAVMVARGDLGVEVGDAALPGLQKKIIREALALKPCR